MKYWPKPWRSRPVHQFLWLVPIGPQVHEAQLGLVPATATQPSMRQRWQSMPSHISSRTKPPICWKQPVR